MANVRVNLVGPGSIEQQYPTTYNQTRGTAWLTQLPCYRPIIKLSAQFDF